MRAEVERLFHELADLPPDARTRYFASHPVDEDTRREVESLLVFDCGVNSFLLNDACIARAVLYRRLRRNAYGCRSGILPR